MRKMKVSSEPDAAVLRAKRLLAASHAVFADFLAKLEIFGRKAIERAHAALRLRRPTLATMSIPRSISRRPTLLSSRSSRSSNSAQGVANLRIDRVAWNERLKIR
jgi:hypothetical protein